MLNRAAVHMTGMPAKNTSTPALRLLPGGAIDVAELQRDYDRQMGVVAEALRTLGTIADRLALAAKAQDEPQAVRRTMSVTEAAGYLGVSRSTMNRLIRSGQIPVQRINSIPKILREDLDEYMGAAR